MSAGAISSTSLNTTNMMRENDAFSELSSEEFVQILVTELTNQDPFEPTDSAAVLEQLSSLRNIESQLSLQNKLESLVTQNAVSQASSMIGKLVEGLDTTNTNVRGMVTSVRVKDGKAELELDTGRVINLDKITLVTQDPDYISGTVGDQLLWDINQDGAVDNADQILWSEIWLSNYNKSRPTDDFGQPVPATFVEGDFDGDGVVGVSDLELLQQVFAGSNGGGQ